MRKNPFWKQGDYYERRQRHSSMIPSGAQFAWLVFRNLYAAPRLDGLLDLGRGFAAYPGAPVQLPPLWRDMLGSLDADTVANANFVLAASAAGDGRYVQDRVQFLQWALVIVAGIPSYDRCVLLTGVNGEHGLEIGNRSLPQRIFGTAKQFVERITVDGLLQAAVLAESIDAIQQTGARNSPFSGPYWRLLSGLDAFLTGLRSPRPHVRLHQFVRAIEAFIPPKASGADGFADHVKMFLVEGDPSPTAILKEMYKLRNASEHHRGLGYGLPNTAEAQRIDTADRRLRQAEVLCRRLYGRLLAMADSDRERWISEDAISSYWQQPEAERMQIWQDRYDIAAIQ